MADPKSVWNEVMKFLGLPQQPRVLQMYENHPVERGQTKFGMTHGPATGKPAEPVPQYIPGTLDTLAEQMGLASDDMHQIQAKLEAWKRLERNKHR